jgi:hypothetical protein
MVAALKYSWPPDADIKVASYGPLDSRYHVAIGTMPHSNEPAGSAFTSGLEIGVWSDDLAARDLRITCIGPIDPPPEAAKFSMPCSIETYCQLGFLDRIERQVEFSYTQDPRTRSQKRASTVMECLAELQPDAFIQLHNDLGAVGPYMYSNYACNALESVLLNRWPLLHEIVDEFEVDWTSPLSVRTLKFFDASEIGVESGESAGIFIERTLDIPVINLELPLFRWENAPEARAESREAFTSWIDQGASSTGNMTELLARISSASKGQHVDMFAPVALGELVHEFVFSAPVALRVR